MTYQSLTKAVSDAGFFTSGDFESKVVCASKLRPEGGYTGNSFWVAQRSIGWFLGTWGVHVYRIPEEHRVADLCIAWLRRNLMARLMTLTRTFATSFTWLKLIPMICQTSNHRPNKQRQPKPGVRLGAYLSPLARRGCVHRSV